MKTEETNKLIAEFLQPTTKHDNFYFPQFKEPYIFQGNLEGYSEVFRTEDLKFHNDWNWLMEVVEKIESLGYNTKIESLEHTRVSIGNGKLTTLIQVDKETKIKAVYNACVTFIEWYNEQK